MTKEKEIEETLLSSLPAALASLEGAKKNATNPHFKSKFADLSSVVEAIRPVAEYGIWFLQQTHENDNGVCVETYYIGHGEKLSAGKLYVPAQKRDAQGYGSALTYARRYSLQTAFGLPVEDDDGNAAVKASDTTTQKLPAHSALKRQVRELVAEIHGVGDWETWVPFRDSDNFQTVTSDCEEKLPQWWSGWAEQPDGFVPLSKLIDEKEHEFAKAKASLATA